MVEQIKQSQRASIQGYIRKNATSEFSKKPTLFFKHKRFYALENLEYHNWRNYHTLKFIIKSKFMQNLAPCKGV